MIRLRVFVLVWIWASPGFMKCLSGAFLGLMLVLALELALGSAVGLGLRLVVFALTLTPTLLSRQAHLDPVVLLLAPVAGGPPRGTGGFGVTGV